MVLVPSVPPIVAIRQETGRQRSGGARALRRRHQQETTHSLNTLLDLFLVCVAACVGFLDFFFVVGLQAKNKNVVTMIIKKKRNKEDGRINTKTTLLTAVHMCFFFCFSKANAHFVVHSIHPGTCLLACWRVCMCVCTCALALFTYIPGHSRRRASPRLSLGPLLLSPP